MEAGATLQHELPEDDPLWLAHRLGHDIHDALGEQQFLESLQGCWGSITGPEAMNSSEKALKWYLLNDVVLEANGWRSDQHATTAERCNTGVAHSGPEEVHHLFRSADDLHCVFAGLAGG